MLPSTLERLADFADIRGESVEATELRSAAAAITALGPTGAAALERRAKANRLGHEQGISPDLHGRLSEVVIRGEEVSIDAGRAGLPILLRRLLELHAITSHEAVSLVRQLGIVTLPDLDAALGDGRLRQ